VAKGCPSDLGLQVELLGSSNPSLRLSYRRPTFPSPWRQVLSTRVHSDLHYCMQKLGVFTWISRTISLASVCAPGIGVLGLTSLFPTGLPLANSLMPQRNVSYCHCRGEEYPSPSMPVVKLVPHFLIPVKPNFVIFQQVLRHSKIIDSVLRVTPVSEARTARIGR
jgi:hypothetical protein